VKTIFQTKIKVSFLGNNNYPDLFSPAGRTYPILRHKYLILYRFFLLSHKAHPADIGRSESHRPYKLHTMPFGIDAVYPAQIHAAQYGL